MCSNVLMSNSVHVTVVIAKVFQFSGNIVSDFGVFLIKINIW